MAEARGNPYEVLGVSPRASFEEVDAAYRRLVASADQDRQRRREIDDAYRILGDHVARIVFDIRRLAPPGSSQMPGSLEEEAITHVGELAFRSGYNLGIGVQDDWSRLGIGGERTRSGIWHSAFFYVFRHLIDGQVVNHDEIKNIVRMAAEDERVRMRSLQWLRTSPACYGEGQAREIAIQLVGTMASGMGRAAGAFSQLVDSSQTMSGEVWKECFVSAYITAFWRILVLGKAHQELDLQEAQDVINTAGNAATSAARPYLNAEAADLQSAREDAAYVQGRYTPPTGYPRYPEYSDRGTFGGLREEHRGANSREKTVWPIAAVVIVILVLGIAVIAAFGGSSVPEVGDCVIVTELPRTPTASSQANSDPDVTTRVVDCDTIGAEKVEHIITYADTVAYPGMARFDRDVVVDCPLRTDSYTYPNWYAWQDGDRTLLCLSELR